jgi:hypothetical protein
VNASGNTVAGSLATMDAHEYECLICNEKATAGYIWFVADDGGVNVNWAKGKDAPQERSFGRPPEADANVLCTYFGWPPCRD